jgi:hypothetical protein
VGLTLSSLAGRKAALIVAHPGHELRLHHWLEVAKPSVFVLTDGSGRTGRSRLASTSAVLRRAGAQAAGIFGRFTDAEVYNALRRMDVTAVAQLMCELANDLSTRLVDYTVGDALEGFNPAHDVCRFLINGAVGLTRRSTGRDVSNFDFLLDGKPDECPPPLRESAVDIHLDREALQRKLSAAEEYEELRAEVRWALDRFGTPAFCTELLRPVADLRQGLDTMPEEPPYYESFGEQQVRAGYYDAVIRYRENVRPLMHAVWRQVGLADEAGNAT